VLPIHIISLESSTARRDLCVGMMGAAGLPFSFFDAVDGRSLSAQAKSHIYDETANCERFKRPLSPSEIGCYLSHLKLWEHIAEGRTPAALVLKGTKVRLKPAAGTSRATIPYGGSGRTPHINITTSRSANRTRSSPPD